MASTSTKVHINLQKRYDRVVILIDMDCFYCQVEEKLNPDLEGKPIAVVQYNAWRGGGIIAVNYPARAKGVTRHMRGDEAQEHCPDINLVRVPNVREKADLTKYREAGKKVAEILQKFSPLLERASIDEAYLDITEQVKNRLIDMNEGRYKLVPSSLENTFAVGYESIASFISDISGSQAEEDAELPEFDENEMNNLNPALLQKFNLNLLVGSSIVNEIRAKVKQETGYECSAGIAHNKILAKLACGMNKPNKQTILSINESIKLLTTLSIHKIKGLGGKFGEDLIEELKIKAVGDLLQFTKSELIRRYDERTGNWLFLIARGIDLEAVTPRFYSKSIGCCKKFPGRNAITGINTLKHWLQELANEIADRLDKDIVENNRKAKQMVVSFIQEINSTDVSSSRSGVLPSYDPETIAKAAFEILQKNTQQFLKTDNKLLNNAIKFLGISVGKFENIQSNQNTLHEMFSKQQKKNETKGINKDKQPENMAEIIIPSTSKSELGLKLDQSKMFQKISFKSQTNETRQIADDSMQESVLNAYEKDVVHFNKEKNTNDTTLKNIEINKVNEKINENINVSSVINKDAEINENYLTKLNFDNQNPSEISSIVNNDSSSSNENSAAPNTSSNNLDYTKTYAEYTKVHKFEFSEEDFVKCSECDKKILNFDFQTHLDAHLAFKLSQQLREEYRNELKNQSTLNSNSSIKTKKNDKFNNSLCNSKTQKVKKKKAPISPLGNIKKFLKSHEETKINDLKNCVKCAECGCLVDELKIFEHKDLHLAQQIQREWNQSQN